jgi:bacterioferritin (cytochrome b1)
MDLDKTRVVDLLSRILENELAGVVRYTHYSFLVYGFSRTQSSTGYGRKPPRRWRTPSRRAR